MFSTEFQQYAIGPILEHHRHQHPHLTPPDSVDISIVAPAVQPEGPHLFGQYQGALRTLDINLGIGIACTSGAWPAVMGLKGIPIDILKVDLKHTLFSLHLFPANRSLLSHNTWMLKSFRRLNTSLTSLINKVVNVSLPGSGRKWPYGKPVLDSQGVIH